MKKPSASLLAFVAAAATLLSVPAQSQTAFKTSSAADWGKVVAAANAEGKVILYATPVPATLALFKAAFEKAYPSITVEYTRLIGTQLVGKVDQDRAANVDGADVIITPEVTWVGERAKQGSLKAPAGPAAGAWPVKYIVSGVSPVLALEPLILAYNTNLVKTQVTGYQDLLRPEFKGKIAMVEPNAGVLVAWYDWLEKTQGADFLTKLAAQNPRLYVSALPITQGTVVGEVAFTGFTVPTVAAPLIAQGAPLKMVVPNPSVGTPYAGALLSWAKRPNAAAVFLDFMMSTAGQTVWAGKGDVGSPIGVPGSLDASTISPLDQSKYPPDVSNAYQAKWGRIFKGK
jgi:iron(III) transport system substrate-binding protein